MKGMTRFAVTLALSACTVGPNYRRPDPALPPAFATATEALPPQPSPSAGPSFGDLVWSEFLKDEVLVDLVRTAVRENWDVQIAANRVLQAEAQVRLARSAAFPAVGIGTSSSRSRSTPANLSLPWQGVQTTFAITGSASYAVDLWGGVRRQVEAARAALLGAEEGRRIVVQSVVLGLVETYLQLRDFDEELAISRRTLESRRESLRLVRLREERGVASLVDVRQAESLIETAEQAISQLELEIPQQEDLIHTLMGGYPGAVPRGRPLTEQGLVVSVPIGLPSSLLERRPDIRASEQQLVAANAQVGVAKAAFFPSITLTASGGTVSNALSGLFAAGSTVWSIGKSMALPIFEGGALTANRDLAQLQKEEAVLVYVQTVREAFREVADALVAIQKSREVRVGQEALVQTLADQLRLSTDRYTGGVTTFLEVLDTERQLFDQQRGLVQAQRAELFATLALYQALGGGWQPEGTASSPPPL